MLRSVVEKFKDIVASISEIRNIFERLYLQETLVILGELKDVNGIKLFLKVRIYVSIIRKRTRRKIQLNLETKIVRF